MDSRDESIYYAGYPTNTVVPPVQPHHPASLQQRSSNHIQPLAPFPDPNFNISLHHHVSHSLPTEEIHEQITVETPQPKQRRRRGANAANASALASPGGDVMMQTPTKPLRQNPNHGIVVKTKFPVARIKRIMQADEDVGKVAQVTPVIVSKALELFMVALCAKASEQARSRSSKRITAAHLKQVVAAEEQFDFLAEVMAKVPDVPLPSEGSGHNGDSDENGNGNGGPPGSVKKPRKPRTRKPKDEEF